MQTISQNVAGPISDADVFMVARAAAAVGLSVSQVNNFIDRDLACPELDDLNLVLVGSGQRYLTLNGLLALQVCAGCADTFQQEARRTIVAAALRTPTRKAIELNNGICVVNLTSFQVSLAAGLDALHRAEAAVSIDPAVMGGEPCLADTRTSVYTIAGLADAHGIDEVKLAYDWITDAEIAAAVLYAKAHPRRGRPVRGKSVKDVLARKAGKKRSPRSILVK